MLGGDANGMNRDQICNARAECSWEGVLQGCVDKSGIHDLDGDMLDDRTALELCPLYTHGGKCKRAFVGCVWLDYAPFGPGTPFVERVAPQGCCMPGRIPKAGDPDYEDVEGGISVRAADYAGFSALSPIEQQTQLAAKGYRAECDQSGCKVLDKQVVDWTSLGGYCSKSAKPTCEELVMYKKGEMISEPSASLCRSRPDCAWVADMCYTKGASVTCGEYENKKTCSRDPNCAYNKRAPEEVQAADVAWDVPKHPQPSNPLTDAKYQGKQRKTVTYQGNQRTAIETKDNGATIVLVASSCEDLADLQAKCPTMTSKRACRKMGAKKGRRDYGINTRCVWDMRERTCCSTAAAFNADLEQCVDHSMAVQNVNRCASINNAKKSNQNSEIYGICFQAGCLWNDNDKTCYSQDDLFVNVMCGDLTLSHCSRFKEAADTPAGCYCKNEKGACAKKDSNGDCVKRVKGACVKEDDSVLNLPYAQCFPASGATPAPVVMGNTKFKILNVGDLCDPSEEISQEGDCEKAAQYIQHVFKGGFAFKDDVSFLPKQDNDPSRPSGCSQFYMAGVFEDFGFSWNKDMSNKSVVANSRRACFDNA